MSSNPITDSSMSMKIVPSCNTTTSVMADISKGVIGPSAPDARKMKMGNARRRAAHPYGAINRLRILAPLHCLYLPQSSAIRLMLEFLSFIGETARNEFPKEEHAQNKASKKTASSEEGLANGWDTHSESDTNNESRNELPDLSWCPFFPLLESSFGTQVFVAASHVGPWGSQP